MEYALKNNSEDKKDDFHYADGRDERVKKTGEIFTPPDLVNEMLDGLGVDWSNPPQDKTFCDPTCGSGNFLVELAKRGIPLKNLYGAELMPDNVETCKRRLKEIYTGKMSEEEINFHLGRNIVEADALTYHYEFWCHKAPDKALFYRKTDNTIKVYRFVKPSI